MINIKEKLTEAEVKDSMPSIIKEMLELLQEDFININSSVILNYIVCNLIRMFSTKKTTIDEAGNKILFNWFSLIFMDSGDGKDRLATTIENHILKNFIEWYRAETEKLYFEQLEEYEQKLKEIKNEGEKHEEGFNPF